MFAVSRRFLNNLVYAGCAVLFLFCSAMLLLPAQADDTSDVTPDQIISKMKDRLHLTEDQEAKLRPIIEELVNKRHDIKANSMLDAKTKRSSLQQLQWSTDMRLGQIFTEEQMAEYQRFREEHNESYPQGDSRQGGDIQRNKGFRSGGQIGF